MTSGAYRGVVRGGVIVLREQTPLVEGVEVLVTPMEPSPGSPALLLAAMETSPSVPAGWVDELEHLIAQGRRPATLHDPFGDEPSHQERQ